MIALPAFFRPRRARPSNIDLTAFPWVADCPPELDDEDTRPRGDPRLGAVAILGSGFMFWVSFAWWLAFLMSRPG